MNLPAHVDERLFCRRLDCFRIETPSWGYADTGTRFGKFLQDAAANCSKCRGIIAIRATAA